MSPDGRFSQLWKGDRFTRKILHFVIDEAQCISLWGEFRHEYLNIGNLRFLIPETIPFYVASATLPSPVLLDITDILCLRPNETEHIVMSCDRPDVHLVVRPIKHHIRTYHDLAFLLPKDFVEGITPPPDPFLVFFDSTKATEHAVHALQKYLPPELRDKIRYFHAGMTQTYREDESDKFKGGETWGMMATSSFGMVSEFQAVSF